MSEAVAIPGEEGSHGSMGRARNIPRVSILSAIVTPWRLLHPARAAIEFVHAPWPGFVLAYLLAVLVLSAFVILETAISETAYWDYSAGITQVQSRSIQEVFSRWMVRPGNSPLVAVPISFAIVIPMGNLLLAWLALPSCHRTGSLARSLATGFRACAASAGVFVLAAGFCGAALAWMERYLMLSPVYVDDFNYRSALFFGIVVLALLWLYWLDRATWAAGAARAGPDVGPRCDGCGYDLTHLPEAGVCSECGRAIESMLRPDGVRAGIQWQRGPRFGTFVDATTALLLDRARFYRTMWVRAPLSAARHFALVHLALIGGLAGVWLLLMLAIFTTAWGRELLCIPAVISLVVIGVGYCLLRLAMAMAFSWSAVHRQLEDGAWGLPVLYYDAAFLWVFCAANGLFFTSLFVTDMPWVSRMFGALGNNLVLVQGVPLEAVFVAAYNLVLFGWWVRRLLLNLECIRWNNY